MKPTILYYSFWLITALLAVSCVTQRQYQDLQKEKETLEKKLAFQDSVSQKNLGEDETSQELQTDLKQAWSDVERLKATNVNLNQSYQELLKLYSGIVNQNREMLNTSSDIQTTLRGQIDSRSLDVQERERRLTQMELDLRAREQRIAEVERNYGQALNARDQEIMQLQQELDARNQDLARAQNSLNVTLDRRVDGQEMNVRQDEGRIYITVSEELLFRSGSTTIDSKGKAALSDVAKALQQERNMNIIVEGHTDNEGSPSRNWELSLNRAMSVARELMAGGIAADRITVSGKGQFAPLASNATAQGRAMNRRTEIILVPRN